ncbi:adhesive plaque matrix protein 2-like [Parasteatoda tepidariorum]|uniref:adhesive plaque matrix protein 2-like n=1 Tax=Parasteatoda tepidariorum TaxID=114398 RepID=UPI0039BC3D62
MVKDGKEICKCQSPYRGDNCEIGPCTNNPCSNGGKCTMYSKVPKCDCLPGFYGEKCEKDVCYLRDVCKNGGTCRPDGFNKFKCECRPHYYGTFCDNVKQMCLEGGKSKECSKLNARCVESPNVNEGYTCNCENGYDKNENGFCIHKCRIKKNEEKCIKLSANCVLDETYQPICKCPPLFQEDANRKCVKEVSNTPESTEPEGITSTNSHESTESTLSPKTDISLKTTFSTCDCGLHSLSCDFNHEGNKICSCETGFSQMTDVCVDCYCGEKSVNCSFGRNLEKKCWCNKGYGQMHGACKKTCSYDVDCQNGGICKHNGNDGFCECHADYSGDRCEVNNVCRHLHHICGEHGGICVIHDGLPQCECPPDKEYQKGVCKTICDASKCIHGQCEIFGHSYKCRCFADYTGKHCDKKSLEESRDNELIVTIFAITISMTAVTMFGIVCWLTLIRMKSKVFTQDPEKVNLI